MLTVVDRAIPCEYGVCTTLKFSTLAYYQNYIKIEITTLITLITKMLLILDGGALKLRRRLSTI